jgi:hypothetical protein
MIHRRSVLCVLSSAALVLGTNGKTALAEEPVSDGFKQALAEITRGRPTMLGRMSIVSDSIVKTEEPLLVAVLLHPLTPVGDEPAKLSLLMSRGPWPKAYVARLRTVEGRARFVTRLRVLESCTLHAFAEIDVQALFGATHEVKVSAGAYSR